MRRWGLTVLLVNACAVPEAKAPPPLRPVPRAPQPLVAHCESFEGCVEACGRDALVECGRLGWYAIDDPERAAAVATTLDGACRLGEAASCSVRGMIAAQQGDREGAERLCEVGCRLGNGLGCFQLGRWRGDEELRRRGSALLRAACSAQRDMDACQELETVVKLGRGYIGACFGDAAACTALGFEYERGRTVPQDFARAAELYEIACGNYDALGCDGLGYLHEHGLGRPQSYQQATLRYHESCGYRSDLRKGCYDEGRMVRDGLGTARDDKRAFVLFRETCDEEGGVGNLGCDALAEMIEQGRATQADLAHAVRLFERSCDRGDMKGCADLAEHYRKGRGVNQRADKAAVLLQKSCDGGHAPGCVALGYMRLNGDEIAAEPVQAASLFRKACDLGLQRGCDALARAQAGQQPWEAKPKAKPGSRAPKTP